MSIFSGWPCRAVHEGARRDGAARISRRLALGLIVALSLTSGFAGTARAADSELQHILAPSGKLRAGLYTGTPTSYLPSQSGEPKGVGYELGKALAQRLGVPYEPVVFPKNADVLDAVKTGKVDVAFTNASPARAKEMDFAQPYLQIELGYLVPQGSKVSSIGAVDTKGNRVGVTLGSSSEGELSRDLHNAELVRAATFPIAVDMLKDGQLDAFATNKATLFELSDKIEGSKILDGHWGYERHGIAIPKGRDAGREFVRQFTADVMANGLVAAAMERAGLRGAQVAGAK
jgi:polar amino acid transport system substrate-binding protein